jgi:peptide/nickel transport system permease protein
MSAVTSSVEPAITAASPAPRREPGYWAGVWRRLSRDKAAMICLGILTLLLLAFLLAPLIAPADPYQTSMIRRLKPVGSPGYLLGTDELGRDMLSRLLYGGRQSWFIGITPVVGALFIGGFLGILAGYAGGLANTIIMRTTDIFYAFPSVLLAVAVSGALGPGVGNAIIALMLVFIPAMIRISESAASQVRNLDYVAAAQATGAGPLTIMRVFILPNTLAPILVYATSLVSVSMILAAGLSFLGLGTKPPEPEWGLMLNTLRTAIYKEPLVAMLPGFCIYVTSLCFNMVSDGLRTAMDVRD